MELVYRSQKFSPEFMNRIDKVVVVFRLLKEHLSILEKSRMLGLHGWYSTNILGNRDGEVLDDPESFKTKEESKLSVLEYILQPEVYPQLYKDFSHVVRINYYPPRGDNKEGWDNIDIFGWLGYPMQIKIDFLCRDSILAAPIVLDLALFLDLAQRVGMKGTQEWLSFYFKSPMTAPGLYPEHDIFIQLMKLKGVLRNFLSEDHITHMGLICGKALENGDAYQQCLLYFTTLLSNVLV